MMQRLIKIMEDSKTLFALQNCHGHAKGFLRTLQTIWAYVLRKVRQPCHCWYSDSLWPGRSGDPNLDAGEISRRRGPSSLLSNGYLVSFPPVKRPARGASHPFLSKAEVEYGQSYTCTSLCACLACNGTTITFFIYTSVYGGSVIYSQLGADKKRIKGSPPLRG